MKNSQIKALTQLNIELNDKKAKIFDAYARIFLEKNSRLNLISKNDEKFLFEKHIFDSLAINKFLKHKAGQTLLDIGTGGGFPAVPVAIFYDELKVYAIDSIRKKINAIEEIKSELDLKNLVSICDRVENISETYDYITTRAVAPVKNILEYAVPKLKKNGYFIAYKSKKSMEELKDARQIIRKLNIEVVDILGYVLPMEEVYERNLIIFKKTKP